MIATPDRDPAIRGFASAAPAGGDTLSAGVAVIGSQCAFDEATDGETRISALHLGATAAALTAFAFGVNFDTGAATMLCCSAILLLGLPHGALDMVALLGAGSSFRATAFYLALAGAMALLWWIVPGAALLLFFAIAIAHFAEDWPGPEVIAYGGAISLLAAPMLLHRLEIDALFTVIAGRGAIPPLADWLLLVAPVAIATGLTGCAVLWAAGRRMLAISSGAAIAGMIVLPPLAGLALTFGLFHSPRQFARGLRELGRKQSWHGPVAAATAAALLLVLATAEFGAPPSFSAAIMRATFIVLSVLTVPHMLLPRILRLATVSRRG